MWHPFKRRMSHIRVVLTTRNKQIPNAKSQININEGKSEVKSEKVVEEKKGKNGTKS